MFEVKFPSVGESITTGVLGLWSKQSGEYVHAGDSLGEIETDKVTSEVFADVSGAFTPTVGEGDEIEVGQVIGTIDEKAEAPAATAAPATEPVQETKLPAPASTGGAGITPEDRQAIKAAPAPKAETGPQVDKVATMSPAVRTLVEEHGLDPAAIPASGKGGRLLKSDVLSAVAEGKKLNVAVASGGVANGKVVPAGSTGERTTRKKMTPLRRRIAQRLVSAQQEAALLTTFNEVDMSSVMRLRKQFQDRFVAKHEIKLGFMSFFVKAVIYALKEVPGLNAQIDGEEIIQNHFYDIGVAISTDKGLLVPVIRGADALGMAGIEGAIIDYAKKSRAGKITMPDLEGGVFTITNGGTFGSMLSTPLLNPPQSGILGMHNIVQRPMAIDGRVEIRPMMYLALTYDHRIVDGKEAVTFLVRVKEYIEQPSLALLDL